MSPFDLFALLLFGFGAVAFPAAFVGFLAECRGKRLDLGAIVDGAITLTCSVWFVVNVLLVVEPLIPGLSPWWLWTALMGLALFFPGLILHQSMASVHPERRPARRIRWMAAVSALYGAGLVVYVVWLAGVYGWFGVPRDLALRLGNLSIPTLFISTALLSMVFVGFGRRRGETRKQRQTRRGHLVVLGATVLIFLPLVLHLTLDVAHTEIISVLARGLPLAFLLVLLFNESRFRFFDVLIKRGAVMLATLTMFAVAFAVTLPWLDRLEPGWTRPWFSAFLVLPAALILPWLSRVLGQWLDSVLLGRRFSAEEAVKHFLDVVHEATSEFELLAGARKGLEEIFRAEAEIRLGLHPAPEGRSAVVEVPIVSGEETLGVVRMGPRENDVPYFSQDVALLASLSGVLAALLENVRLQRRKQEQEALARELSLEASRSELKALRAQINPHFLFNALNAIAGLIHHDPARADRAVEQLAEVFRYTLRSSQREWATLDQELDFAGAYLEVEQARFGSRLEARIDASETARALVVPTMVLQTLVENAVKHGISSVRGQGRIEISAELRGDRLVVEVADNGQGFDAEALAGGGRDGQGFGLSNVRGRLAGHFGDDAALSVRRDAGSGRTLVAVEMPVDRLRPAAHRAVGSEGS